MRAWIIYEIATGRAVGYQYAPEGSTPGISAGEAAIDATNERTHTHYVDISGQPTLAARTAFSVTQDKDTITADEVDVSIISSIPAGTTVTITGPDVGEQVIVDDGTLEISASASTSSSARPLSVVRSPAQGYQWVENNVTDLASAKELLKRLTAVTMYLLKKQQQ